VEIIHPHELFHQAQLLRGVVQPHKHLQILQQAQEQLI
jgi:hypothetical protein